MNSKHVLQPYWDLALSNINADVLTIAIEQHWFDFLSSPYRSADFAKQLQLNAKNVGYYLDILWSMGLLDRQQEANANYQNSPIAQRYFCSQSEDYIGDAWLFRRTTLTHRGQQLLTQIQADFSPTLTEQNVIEKNWAKAANKQIAQEQQAITKHTALSIIKSLPGADKCKKLLDLGGGPGFIAIELIKAMPALNGVIFDFPDTTAVAQQNIIQAGLTKRLLVMSGNIVTDPIGSGYDLIWCSSVLHFLPNTSEVLVKIYSALNSGGVLISAHAEITPDRNVAKRVLPYYLSMQMQGHPLLAAGKLAQLFAKIGFVQIEQQHSITFPVAPVSLVIARKA